MTAGCAALAGLIAPLSACRPRTPTSPATARRKYEAAIPVLIKQAVDIAQEAGENAL